jgi:hypothetical protein
MSLFRYLQEKDVFEAFYKKNLAKRLLLGEYGVGAFICCCLITSRGGDPLPVRKQRLAVASSAFSVLIEYGYSDFSLILVCCFC